MKRAYLFVTYIMLSVSLFGQDLMHTTEFYWADKFSDRSIERSGVLEVNSPIFNDFLANAPDDRIVINRSGCEFHTDGTEDVSGYPSWLGVRAELREDPMSTVPTGFTHVYEYIWDIDLLPHLEGPVTIFQRFHKGNDGPDLDIELAGEGQFADAPNGSVIIHGFNSGWIRTQKELQARNHLLVAIYSESSGHYKISLNGETLIENDAYTIADTTYSGQQFGIYNHGGTIARIQFTHIWYRCRQYSGKADFSLLNSTDPNVTSVTSDEKDSISPKNFILQHSYPNPFNNSVQINVTAPQNEVEEIISFRIYDIMGRVVKNFEFDRNNNNSFTFTWMGQNDEGNNVASGTYIFAVHTSKKIYSTKLILLK